MSDAYDKFLRGERLTKKEAKSLSLIDRIRFIVDTNPRVRLWNPKKMLKYLRAQKLVADQITESDVAYEAKRYYG